MSEPSIRGNVIKPPLGLHLYMITLWHPERFIGCTVQDLASYPSLRRDRAELEERRKSLAAELGQPISLRPLHDRIIANTGKPTNRLRYTWLEATSVLPLIETFAVRLVDTSETGSQARWRCEFRMSWGEQGAELPKEAIERLHQGVARAGRLSIRQLWRNATSGRRPVLPLAIPEESVSEVGNLHLGPLDDRSTRQAHLVFEEREGAWWVSDEVVG